MTTKVISKNFRAVKVNKVCYRDRHSFHVLASHFTSLLSFLLIVREECTERFRRQWPEVVLYRFHYTQCVYLPEGEGWWRGSEGQNQLIRKKKEKRKRTQIIFPGTFSLSLCDGDAYIKTEIIHLFIMKAFISWWPSTHDTFYIT